MADELTIPTLATIDAKIEATKVELAALQKLRWAARELLRAKDKERRQESVEVAHAR